ncbi:hypothetical protein CKO15_03115 [Halorhodospira abdelmalekii]|uniref:SPOR domain-containing protein n=1 Tax=Halorhodospira abdelmalekii TaxID=421629 RepID=UPI00190433DD|nr:SPOR domain-containing protein [Halorhodospira abdelmalekii]MBK1734288.1 hypothetical protein [Halorhodospira abdelmalekii]
MDPSTKRQLVGAAVIVALAVIFLPMLFSGPEREEGRVDVPLDVPEPRAVDRDAGSGERADEVPGLATRESQVPRLPEEEVAARQERRPPSEADDRRAGERPAAREEEAHEVRAVEPQEGAFAVQVGSFRERDNAYAERDRIRELGMPAYVDESELGGSPIYRVRVGPVMERSEAESLMEQAASDAGLEGWVVAL